jgi:uncharacterized membrane protein YvlD (DUF360 family)
MIGVLLAAIVSGSIIWFIGKMKLGLEVDNFGWAMLAGILIGFFTNLIMNLIPTTDGIIRLMINLVITAAVIFGSGALLRGMTVNGYSGALIAAVSIAVINYLLTLLLLSGAGLAGSVATPQGAV